MTYGKLINGELLTPTAIHTENGWITNPTPEQYIEHGYKLVIDNGTTFSNYERTYSETEAQIIVNYTEITIPERPWDEQTNFQIKFTPIDLLELLKEVPAMIDYINKLTVYSDEFGNQYLYVDYFVDMERELIERYGAIIKERS